MTENLNLDIVLFLFIIVFVIPLISSLVFGSTQVPSKTKIWTCETCDAKLKAVQIKFGLCPQCGKKVKSFRGHHRGW